jgi:hypothetical protein
MFETGKELLFAVVNGWLHQLLALLDPLPQRLNFASRPMHSRTV